MAAKETKNNGIIKKQNIMKQNGIRCTFQKQKHFLFLYLICILLDLQMCQVILPDPVHWQKIKNSLSQLKMH